MKTEPVADKSAGAGSNRVVVAEEGKEGAEGLKKQFGFFAALGLAFVILNSWASTAASLSVAIPSGGPVAILYGEVAAGIGSLALAASLAEICSVWPTSGGPYHRTHLAAGNASGARGLSYANGWLSALGWWALYGSSGALPTSLIFNIVSLWKPDFAIQRWQLFVCFVAVIALSGLLNVFLTRQLHRIDKVAFVWSIFGAVVSLIAVLAIAAPNYQPAEYVLTTFVNETGWNNFLAFMLGLLQAAFGLNGFDAVSHVIDEMPNPRVHAPRVMVAAIVIGFTSTFVLLLSLLFCTTNVDEVISSSAGPLVTIFYQATKSKAGATAFTMLPLVTIVAPGQGCLTTVSRMTWSLACDEALPFSSKLNKINARLSNPLAAIAFSWVFAFILGLLYLGSSAAFNAIVTSSVVALSLFYCLPISIVLSGGRDAWLAHRSSFSLGRVLGPVANIIGIAYGVIISVFFLFPPTLPTTGSSMNYVACVLFVIGLIAVVNWFASARKVYVGPRDA